MAPGDCVRVGRPSGESERDGHLVPTIVAWLMKRARNVSHNRSLDALQVLFAAGAQLDQHVDTHSLDARDSDTCLIFDDQDRCYRPHALAQDVMLAIGEMIAAITKETNFATQRALVALLQGEREHEAEAARRAEALEDRRVDLLVIRLHSAEAAFRALKVDTDIKDDNAPELAFKGTDKADDRTAYLEGAVEASAAFVAATKPTQ